MKHLKKFNEKSLQELTFDDFKLIIDIDISDKFSFEISYDDYSKYKEEPFYDCIISLPDINDDVEFNISLDYLNDIIGDFDSTEPPGLTDIESHIDYQLSNLNKYKNSLDEAISNTKKIKDFFYVILNKTIPRLENFYNCREITIGYSVGEFRLCFEL